jgi:Lon protease-like protein
MISPVTNEEKQKLLEAVSIDEKIKTLEDIINFYLHETSANNQTVQ